MLKQRAYQIGRLHFEAGDARGVAIGAHGTVLAEDSYHGRIVTMPVDAGESRMSWHALTLDAIIPEGAILTVSAYVCDAQSGSEGALIERFARLLAQNASPEVIADETGSVLACREVSPKGMPLFSAEGRFLWLVFDLTGQPGITPTLIGARVSFPRQTALEWLPEAYRADAQSAEFVTRYLGVFQTLMLQMEDEIDDTHEMFRVDLTPERMLLWLSGWLGIEDAVLFEGPRLRTLMAEAMSLYRMRGTRACLSRIVEIYCGERPYIVESSRAAEHLSGAALEHFARLYGANPYRFTVILSGARITGSRKYKELLGVLRAWAPAHTEVALVALKSNIFLDQYAYLGINSHLNATMGVRLDGRGALPFVALLDKGGGAKLGA